MCLSKSKITDNDTMNQRIALENKITDTRSILHNKTNPTIIMDHGKNKLKNTLLLNNNINNLLVKKLNFKKIIVFQKKRNSAKCVRMRCWSKLSSTTNNHFNMNIEKTYC